MEEAKRKLENLKRAYARLLEVLESYDPHEVDIALDATVQRFEFTFEQAWKAIKKFAHLMGLEECNSPRGCLKLAYRLGWIKDQEQWLSLLEARNLTSHTYDVAVAWRVYELVKKNHRVFQSLIEKLERLLKENGEF
jgi:nucleotidyltransferase substrate binding protein (TIGR01987 family)